MTDPDNYEPDYCEDNLAPLPGEEEETIEDYDDDVVNLDRLWTEFEGEPIGIEDPDDADLDDEEFGDDEEDF